MSFTYISCPCATLADSLARPAGIPSLVLPSCCCVSLAWPERACRGIEVEDSGAMLAGAER
eukprot:3161769-Alexandrium_andersonii.AAC.1